MGLSLGKNLGRVIAICRMGGWLAQGSWKHAHATYSMDISSVPLLRKCRHAQHAKCRITWILVTIMKPSQVLVLGGVSGGGGRREREGPPQSSLPNKPISAGGGRKGGRPNAIPANQELYL